MYTLTPDSFAQRARSKQIPISSNETISVLKELLNTHKPHYCVELGTAVGRGSYHIASTISNRSGILVSIEFSYPSYHTALEFLHQQDITNTIVYYGDCVTVPLERILHDTIDFLYVDAHKAQYHDFYTLFSKYLSPNAIVVFDDILQYAEKIGPIITRVTQQGRTAQFIATDANTDGLLLCTR